MYLLWYKKGLKEQLQVQSQTDFKHTILVFHFPLFYFKALFPDFIYNNGGNKKIRMTQAAGGLHFGSSKIFSNEYFKPF